MDPSDEARERAVAAGASFVFLTIAALAVADLIADANAPVTLRHVLVEGILGVVAFAGFLGMAVRVLRLQRETRDLEAQTRALETSLSASREAAEAFRREAHELIAGLGAAINQQLARWGLTPAESEVAMLLLKGLSHKEIGGIRGVSEATVRQQARAIYRKAGLSGRADLAAFFLEDLLAPRTDTRE